MAEVFCGFVIPAGSHNRIYLVLQGPMYPRRQRFIIDVHDVVGVAMAGLGADKRREQSKYL